MHFEPRSEKTFGGQSIAPNPTDLPKVPKPTPGEEFAELISALRKAEPDLGYPDAARRIGAEHPDLLRRLYPAPPKGAKAPAENASDSEKAGEEFAERVAKAQRAEPGLDYTRATLQVGRADPELVARMY